MSVYVDVGANLYFGMYCLLAQGPEFGRQIPTSPVILLICMLHLVHAHFVFTLLISPWASFSFRIRILTISTSVFVRHCAAFCLCVHAMAGGHGLLLFTSLNRSPSSPLPVLILYTYLELVYNCKFPRCRLWFLIVRNQIHAAPHLHMKLCICQVKFGSSVYWHFIWTTFGQESTRTAVRA